MNKIFALLLSACLTGFTVHGQENLLDELNKQQEDVIFPVLDTFKGTRLINGHSIETRPSGTLEFVISHRFGELSSGAYNLFGLDDSNIRFGLEYALSDRFYLGIGRSSFEKTYDGFVKYRLIRQMSSNGSPLSLTVFGSGTIKTLRTPEASLDFVDKLTYTSQILIGRKFSENISLQLMPTYIHFNLIEEEDNNNDVIAIGAGGRVKISKRVSINAEYYYQVRSLNDRVFNSIAIGVDIETGGHVFQIQFTNSRSMIEKGFIAETYNDFFEGDIHLGFNITRAFQLSES